MSSIETAGIPVAAVKTEKYRTFALDLTEWRRRTWEPTREQAHAATMAVYTLSATRMTRAAMRLRSALGGPTEEAIAEIGRRLSRIEARLETLGGRDRDPGRDKEKRST
jgi:hypothetical protein